jgi:hypothetical protein
MAITVQPTHNASQSPKRTVTGIEATITYILHSTINRLYVTSNYSVMGRNCLSMLAFHGVIIFVINATLSATAFVHGVGINNCVSNVSERYLQWLPYEHVYSYT